MKHSHSTISRWGLINESNTLNPQRDLLGKLLSQTRKYFYQELERLNECGSEWPLQSPQAYEEIDVIISGGGLRGYYVAGAAQILKEMCDMHNITIKRLAGASAGSWCALFIATDVHVLDWIETFYQTSFHSDAGSKSKLLDAYHLFIDSMMLRTFQEDAYLQCNGKVHISITVLTLTGAKNIIVSEFTSNLDLINACIASSNIPFFSVGGFGKKFRGMTVIDGGATNNIPVFRDNKRRQLVFDLGKVCYPFALTLSPSDPSIDTLVLRGALEMRRFCLGAKTEVISWEVPEEDMRLIPTSREMVLYTFKLMGLVATVAVVRDVVKWFIRWLSHLYQRRGYKEHLNMFPFNLYYRFGSKNLARMMVLLRLYKT